METTDIANSRFKVIANRIEHSKDTVDGKLEPDGRFHIVVEASQEGAKEKLANYDDQEQVKEDVNIVLNYRRLRIPLLGWYLYY